MPVNVCSQSDEPDWPWPRLVLAILLALAAPRSVPAQLPARPAVSLGEDGKLVYTPDRDPV
jgi:hypothetical protein